MLFCESEYRIDLITLRAHTYQVSNLYSTSDYHKAVPLPAQQVELDIEQVTIQRLFQTARRAFSRMLPPIAGCAGYMS